MGRPSEKWKGIEASVSNVRPDSFKTDNYFRYADITGTRFATKQDAIDFILQYGKTGSCCSIVDHLDPHSPDNFYLGWIGKNGHGAKYIERLSKEKDSNGCYKTIRYYSSKHYGGSK